MGYYLTPLERKFQHTFRIHERESADHYPHTLSENKRTEFKNWLEENNLGRMLSYSSVMFYDESALVWFRLRWQ